MFCFFAPRLAHEGKKWRVAVKQQRELRSLFFSPEQIVREIEGVV